MYAPSYILVTDPRLAVGRQMLFTGLDGDEAERISNELIDQCGEDIPGRLVVEVASIRGTYGWIAAIDPGQRHFLSQERSVVQTYAGLAAAVLDSQTSLEEARRQATTARTLLDLSSSLSELTNPQEMASHLADAVPSVIDCDRSMVLLREPDVGTWRVAAVCGYPEATTARLLSMVVENQDPNDFLGDVCFHDKIQTRAHRMRFGFPADEDALASAVARLTTNGEVIGDLVVSVTEQPDRLRERPHLSEALRGMSSQVALAIRNARLMEQVRYQALHDALTGLPNRALLLDRMEQALARSRRHGTEVAAMFIDLDGFKAINDALGHSVGDALLTALAERLRLTVRSDDTLGRLGGDEFIAVLEGPSLVAGPEVIAERILNQVREPFLLDSYLGPPLSLTASIGIACGLRPSAAELLHDADIALYQAKAANKDGWVRYHPDMSMGSRIPRSDSMPPSQSSEGHVAPAKL
jgi:diguanylate cyclase (GGDEF)-like protein